MNKLIGALLGLLLIPGAYSISMEQAPNPDVDDMHPEDSENQTPNPDVDDMHQSLTHSGISGDKNDKYKEDLKQLKQRFENLQPIYDAYIRGIDDAIAFVGGPKYASLGAREKSQYLEEVCKKYTTCHHKLDVAVELLKQKLPTDKGQRFAYTMSRDLAAEEDGMKRFGLAGRLYEMTRKTRYQSNRRLTAEEISMRNNPTAALEDLKFRYECIKIDILDKILAKLNEAIQMLPADQ